MFRSLTMASSTVYVYRILLYSLCGKKESIVQNHNSRNECGENKSFDKSRYNSSFQAKEDGIAMTTYEENF